MENQIFCRIIDSLKNRHCCYLKCSLSHSACHGLLLGQVTYPTLSGEAELTKGSPNWWHMGGFCFGQELSHGGDEEYEKIQLFLKLQQNQSRSLGSKSLNPVLLLEENPEKKWE